jgi:hypothetical protein
MGGADKNNNVVITIQNETTAIKMFQDSKGCQGFKARCRLFICIAHSIYT